MPMEGPPPRKDHCTPPQLLPPPRSPLEVGAVGGIHRTLAHPQAVAGEEYLKLKISSNVTMKVSLRAIAKGLNKIPYPNYWLWHQCLELVKIH